MNEKLQFSWGHIIAFIALIAVSYISFVGFTYLTDGNFTIGLIGMGVTDLLYLFFFIGAQQMKASGRKIEKKVVWERILIFGSPVIFIAGMISMSHFWTVTNQNDDIVKKFTGAINNGKQLFSDYQSYADTRIDNYSKTLDNIIAAKDSASALYQQAGFIPGKEQVQKENMVEVLRLQLLSQNFESLRGLALKWIDDANQGANTWNVFLLGNTREIKSALADWEKQLRGFAENRLSNEELLGEVPEFTSDGSIAAIDGIDSLRSAFTTQKFPTVQAIIFGILIYMMLLVPYWVQQRHGRQVASRLSLFRHSANKTPFDETEFPQPSRFMDSRSDNNSKTKIIGKSAKNESDGIIDPPDNLSESTGTQTTDYNRKKTKYGRITID